MRSSFGGDTAASTTGRFLCGTLGLALGARTRAGTTSGRSSSSSHSSQSAVSG
jgi:hypothetical protein